MPFIIFSCHRKFLIFEILPFRERESESERERGIFEILPFTNYHLQLPFTLTPYKKNFH